MRKLIDQLFERFTEIENNQEISTSDLHLATAALLVEVAVSDLNFDDSERVQLKKLLLSECELSEADVDTLISDAETATREASSLFEFTHIVNKHCEYKQKLSLVNNLWKVAYADGELDKYEEHIIRKISDLIHVSHRDFIQEKISVREDSQS
jgi:uncharacterized tellurite resistance protein B-like protein